MRCIAPQEPAAVVSEDEAAAVCQAQWAGLVERLAKDSLASSPCKLRTDMLDMRPPIGTELQCLFGEDWFRGKVIDFDETDMLDMRNCAPVLSIPGASETIPSLRPRYQTLS